MLYASYMSDVVLVRYRGYKSNFGVVPAFKEHRIENHNWKRVDMCHEKVPHRAHGDHMDWPLKPAAGGLLVASLRKCSVKGNWRNGRSEQ